MKEPWFLTKEVKMAKRAISPLVATVLIVLIIIAAIALIWGGIIPIINRSLDVSRACINADVTIGDYTCTSSARTDVQIKHGASDFKLAGMIISVISEGESSSFYLQASGTDIPDKYKKLKNITLLLPPAGGSKLYSLADATSADMVEVIPVAKVGARYVACDNMKQTCDDLTKCSGGVLNLCEDVICQDNTTTCWDGSISNCTSECINITGDCSECVPECPPNPCDDVICQDNTTTCWDGSISNCTPLCNYTTGECEDCTPECPTNLCENVTCPDNSTVCWDNSIANCSRYCNNTTGLCSQCVPECPPYQESHTTTYLPNSQGSNAWRGTYIALPLSLNQISTTYTSSQLNTISINDANYVSQTGISGTDCSARTLVSSCSGLSSHSCSSSYDGDSACKYTSTGYGGYCSAGSACAISPAHRFLFDINESKSSITNIQARVRAVGISSPTTLTLYIWELSTSSFTSLTSGSCSSTCTLTASGSSINDYVDDSGRIYLLTLKKGGGESRIFYAELNVTSG